MTSIEKLFELRKSLERYERELGFDELSEVEKAVLEFIINRDDATITAITKDQYFMKYSLSTIKRAVGTLINNQMINSEQSEADRRAMILSYNKA